MHKEEWVEVHKGDLKKLHDIAEELSLDLQRKELFEDMERAKKIKDIVESARFYKEEVE